MEEDYVYELKRLFEPLYGLEVEPSGDGTFTMRINTIDDIGIGREAERLLDGLLEKHERDLDRARAETARVMEDLEQVERRHDRLCDELAERYMELPLDAEGVPIHVGDVLYCDANGYKGAFSAFAVGDGVVVGNHTEEFWHKRPMDTFHVARYCHHDERTVEDVLREFGDRVLNSGHQWGLDAQRTIVDYADMLRELIGGTE